MKCLICKAEGMIDAKSTYFAQTKHGYVIIENVPCKKCVQCGEVVFSSSVLERIDEIVEKAGIIAGKVSIMDYSQAA